MAGRSADLNILIKAKNLTGAAIAGVQSNLKGIGKDVGRGLHNISQNIQKGILIAGGAAVAGLGFAVQKAIEFEDAFAGVKKTVDEIDLGKAGLSFDMLNDSLREMARTMPITYEDLAGIAEAAGALGIAAPNIEEFTRVAALIGVTTDVSSQDAATALGQLSNVLGLTADDYDNFAATLVDLGNKGASTESQILTIASRAGAGAHLIGLSAAATEGWAAATANLGIEVEAGGSALQKFFLGTLKNVQKDDTLQLMAETAGKTGDAFKKAFEEDASGAMEDFLVGLGDLSSAEQLAVLDGLGFTDIRISRALLGLAGNTDNLTDSLNIAGQAWKDNTALTEEAQKRFETTQSQLIILKNNLIDAAVTIGSAVLPLVNELMTEATAWIQTHQTEIKEFAQNIADGLRDAVGWAKSLDWESIGSSLKMAAGFAKGLIDAFLAMPDWVKQAVITGWGLNKLSGGALGSIIGQLGAGLIKGVLGINAGVVNVNGGVVNGGVGGAGGAAGGLLKSPITWVIGAAAAAELGNVIGHALFYDPAVKPTQAAEQSTFEKFATRNSQDTDKLVKGLQAIKDGQSELYSATGPLGFLFAGDQIDQLKRQESVLRDQLHAQGLTDDDIKRLLAEQHLTTAQVTHNALAVERGDSQVRAQLLANRNSTIGEFNRAHADRLRAEGILHRQVADAAGSDRAMLGSSQRPRFGAERGSHHRLQGVGPQANGQQHGERFHLGVGFLDPVQAGDHPSVHP